MGTIHGILRRFTPELRRYAYLLTGSSETGDDLVEACLHAAVGNPRRITLEPRRSLGYSTRPIRSFRKSGAPPVLPAR